MSKSDLILKLRSASKQFGSVRVLHDVDFDVRAGETHGIVGQNGSGKSTLIKIITGYHAPEPGAKLWLRGEELTFPVHDPATLGIGVIHQDLGMAPDLSIVENVGAGSRFGSSRPGKPIAWKRERARTTEILRRLDLDFSPDTKVSDLSPAGRALVAVVRAIRQLEDYGHSQILLVLDEPTVYLTETDAELLKSVVASLRDQGAGIIFISHRLKEVRGLCDRVTVIRDGRSVATVPGQTEESELSDLIVGRDIGGFYPSKLPPAEGAVLCEVEALAGGRANGVSFEIREGEILGVTGLQGMGHDDLPGLIVTGDRERGRVCLRDEEVSLTLRNCLEHGVAMVPGDRVHSGGWMQGTALENVSLPVLRRYWSHLRLDHAEERQAGAEIFGRFDVRPPAPDRQLDAFSGGNQQKILLAKWLQAKPALLLLEEPTQGVDAGAKKQILEIIRQTAAEGSGILVVSTDYEQLAHLCQRVLVMADGRVTSVLEGRDVTEVNIARACMTTAKDQTSSVLEETHA